MTSLMDNPGRWANVIGKALLGKTLINVTKTIDEIRFELESGEVYKLYSGFKRTPATIEDVNGELTDLIGSPLLVAEATENYGKGWAVWTFYRFATIKGFVVIRWYADCDIYAEAVSWKQVKTKKQEETMKIKPLSDRVVVEPIESSSKSAGGLYLPESAQEKSQEGKIVALGEGRWSEFHGVFYPTILKLDDRVMFAKFAGTELVQDGKKYLLLNERDILAVLG